MLEPFTLSMGVDMTTASQESSSASTSIIGRFASIAALLSLLFLPVAGCNGVQGLSGVDILSAENLDGVTRRFSASCSF
jgi:predicted small secreted protein